mmetsp:Transcript_73502/g.129737  ORF Transcript_73502/g.129737 Transcript_73502/m.129737 type:complete len:220 (-) Transcript_73502:130-789(-)
MTHQLNAAQMHDGYHCHFWKHTDPSAIDGLLQQASEHGVHVTMLAMVRSPLAEITAWEKAAYDLGSCVKGHKLEEDEQRRCTIPRGGGTYHGLTDVWNHYTAGYAKLAEKYPEHDIKLVEYERLVLEPEAVFTEISKALKFAEIANFQMIQEPAKHHGKPTGRAEALRHVIDMEYLHQDGLGNEGLRSKICGMLDHDTMKKIVLNVNGEQRSYETDCAA